MSRSHRVMFALSLLALAGAPFWHVAHAAAAIRPTELDIPAIDAVMPIIPVGLTRTRAMDVPHNYVQAGWYDRGAVPGDIGSAVIDGHVDNGGYHPTIDGVFKHLDRVERGDIILVALSDGSLVPFEVTSSAVYGLAAFPSAKVFDQTGDAYLKIITCHGVWEPKARTYSQRLVVTAVRV